MSHRVTKFSHASKLAWAVVSTIIAMLFFQLNGFSVEIRYRVKNLQATAPAAVLSSSALAINRYGDVVGSYWMAEDVAGRPFIYQDSTGFAPLEHPSGFFGYPQGINDRRQVAVFGHVAGTSGGTNAWRYSPGIGYEPLGTLAGDGQIGDVPIGINNAGQVVGRSDISSPPWQVAFLYSDGIGMVSLGSLGTNRAATAEAINDSGQITGHSGGYVFLYSQAMGMVPIGQGAGFAINKSGIVAGRTSDYEAAVFDNGTTQRLGNVGGLTWGNGINDQKIIVGSIFYTAAYPQRFSAFIWTETEGIADLQLLVEPGWFFRDVWAINNNGQMVGEGGYGVGSSSVAVRLDPIPPKLAIQNAGTNLVVSWSPNWPGIVLESTDDLSTTNWPAMATGGTNVVSVPTSEQQRFFRLNLDGIRGLCCAPE